jgi:hypothetical protein
MIKIDVSRLIPQRAGTYLLALIPGIVLELSLAVGDPQLAHSLVDRVNHVYPFRPYFLFAIFMASCWVVGQIFFLAAWFAEVLVSSGLRLIHMVFASRWLYRAFGKVQGFPSRRNLLIRSLSRIFFHLRMKRHPPQLDIVRRCRRLAAEQLLKRGYGIDLNTEPWSSSTADEWEVWSAVLGKPLRWYSEVQMGTRTIVSCGIAMLSALFVTPALREPIVIVGCAVLTLAGCVQLWMFASWTHDPINVGFFRLRSVLAELSEANSKLADDRDSSEQGLRVAIDANDKDEN